MELYWPSLVLDGIAVLILLISLILGIRRGFFKSLAFLAAVTAAVIVSMTFSGRFADWINERFVNDSVNEKIAGMIEKIIPAETGDGETSGDPAPVDSGGEDFLDGLKNDDSLRSLVERLGSSAEELLDQIKDAADGVLANAAEALAKPLSDSISKGAAVIILFVATLIVSLIVIKLFDIIFSTKPLSGINRFFGGITGLVKGLLLAFVFCYAACRLIPPLTDLGESVPTDIIDKTFIVKYLGLM